MLHVQRMKGSLRVVVGPMFAGKTEHLIGTVRAARIAGQRIAVVKPSVDTRNPGVEITSHAGNRIEAVTVARDGSDLPVDVDVLAIDEVQFFSGDAVPKIVSAAFERNVVVVACGLDLDAFGRPFGPVPSLLAFADEVVKLRGMCAACGAPSSRSQRLVASRERDAILVGGSDLYEPRCRACFTPGG